MCGNFGIIFLDPRFRDKVLPLLREMIRITMMRGAQSAGIATYLRTASAANTRERLGFLSRLGVRSRVVNGKRTDLSALVMRRLAWDLRRAAAFHGVGDAIEAPQVFQGHTRFATTSISNLDGCHPHQWTPPSTRMAWGYDSGSGAFVGRRVNAEGFITHNGDLDFFTINGVCYELDQLQQLLPLLLHHPLPSRVDSACVAGLLELLRTKGLWMASVRYAHLYAVLRTEGNLLKQHSRRWLLSPTRLKAISAVFEKAWAALLADEGSTHHHAAADEEASMRAPQPPPLFATSEEATMIDYLTPMLRRKLISAIGKDGGPGRLGLQPGDIEPLVDEAISAFFSNGLLIAGRKILESAKGSFGLVLSHSLDANELLVAARGQSMSVAFYPELEMVLFGSEAAATKAALRAAQEAAAAGGEATGDAPPPPTAEGMPSGCYRLDLNDLYGEVVRLQWGGDELVAQMQHGATASVLAMRYGGDRSGALVVTTLAEGGQPYEPPRSASSTCAATASSSRRRRRTTILWAPTCARSRRCSNGCETTGTRRASRSTG